jgi:glycosyltransferase involved in cell wall biosynthesis
VSAELSVVIAVRDGAASIAEAVRSAESADGLLEILVVDDGSSDLSAEAAAAASDAVRLLRIEPAGLPAAHNQGVAAARGSLIAFLDADDRWVAPSPDPRRTALAGADGAQGRVRMLLGGTPHGDPFHLGGIAGLLLRREAMDAVGAFDEGLQRGHDLDWLLRAREAGLRLEQVDAVVLEYRLGPGGLSNGGAASSEGLLAALGRAAARRAPR